MDLQQQQSQPNNGLLTSASKRKGSPCQQDDDSQADEIEVCSGPSLPEDIWCHIHSYMPMRDAARAACVSHAFLCSWRCHPNLTFDNETFGLNKSACGKDEIARDFICKADQILKKHSGIGAKRLKIHMFKFCNTNDSCYLDSWLQVAVTPGIDELALALPMNANYNFPCSLLSNGNGDSIRYLHLAGCSFRPTAELCWSRALRRLHLRAVCIKGGELGSFLSSSLALEQLQISYCDGIVCLKVPCMLQRLSDLKVFECSRLRVIDSEAQNISSFSFTGDHRVKLSLGKTLQMKNLHISFSGTVHYTRVELPFSMPNLETATIRSSIEMANTPMLHSKYLHLKELIIALTAYTFTPTCDYLSLVSLFDACPSLETFVLNASQQRMEHVLIFTDPSYVRRIHEQHHHKLKSVKGHRPPPSADPSLPEDIWHHIHSFMPMRDAARFACVSHAFLHTWRSHPNLNFGKDTLGFIENVCQKDESARFFYIKVDDILKRHSGIGVKKLRIQITSDYSAKDSCYLNKWLQKAVTPGIEELTLILVPFGAKYNFPCSLLLNRSGDSIRYLHLARCSFHPKVTRGFTSLTRLHLCLVRITENELGCLVSHSLALERLELRSCDKIIYLKVPRLLQRVNYLEVRACAKLKVIDNEAPNISSFTFGGDSTVQLSLGETLQMKSLTMNRCGSVFYARAQLPPSMPNLEALTIHSQSESAYAPMLPSKFLCLRHLSIAVTGVPFSAAYDYDYLSLASFLDAAPSLETFNLNVRQRFKKNVSVLADPANLRQMRELQHHNLRSVMITGFSSAKSLVELTCHVLDYHKIR